MSEEFQLMWERACIFLIKFNNDCSIKHTLMWMKILPHGSMYNEL